MCAGLCTTHAINGATADVPHTPLVRPHPPNTPPTVLNALIHNPIGALAAPRPCCPQHAQPLLLLLRYLHRFFFEIQAWGRAVHTRRPGPRCLGLSACAVRF